MSWKLAGREEDARVTAFVERCEPGTVVFSEYLRKFGIGRKSAKYQRVLFYEQEETISAAVLQTGAGFFVPTSRDGALPEATALRDLVAPEDNRIHSIMGELKEVHSLAQAIALPLSQSVDYHLMHRTAQSSRCLVDSPLPSLSYHWATIRDAKKLSALQEAYEREEVLLPGHLFNPRVSMENLKYHLRQQLIVYATHQGAVIAKAATNARGFGCDQLGGVYTRPDYRRRGVARWLVALLLRRLRKEGKGASLFVKPHNLAAVELYRALGFSIVGPFRISYY